MIQQISKNVSFKIASVVKDSEAMGTLLLLVGKYTGTTVKFAIYSKIKDLLSCYLKEVLMCVLKET